MACIEYNKKQYDIDLSVWKPIPNYPGYFASINGELGSVKRNKFLILTGCPDKDGYIKHSLYENGKTIYKRRSSLIALGWLGEKPKDLVVCHKNGNNQDDRPENLEYKTQHENILDKHLHGTVSLGERNGLAKITNEIAKNIFLSKLSIPNICKKYNISESIVRGVKFKKTWRHVTDKLL